MKKGILMTLVAVAAAAAGLVVAIMTALNRSKKDSDVDIYIDNTEYLDDDFDAADESAFAEDFDAADMDETPADEQAQPTPNETSENDLKDDSI